MTISGATTSDSRGPKNDVNKGVPHVPKTPALLGSHYQTV